MTKIAIAGLISGGIVLVLGLVISVLMRETATELAQGFTFEMSGLQRALYHTALRLVSGLAVAIIVAFAMTQLPGLGQVLVLATAIWFLAYVPGFLLLSDLGTIGLGPTIKFIAWGWLEIFAAATAAWWWLGR